MYKIKSIRSALSGETVFTVFYSLSAHPYPVISFKTRKEALAWINA